MASTGFLTHDDFLRHATGPGHPERPERLAAVLRRVRESGLGDELDRREPPEATERAIASVHDPEYVARAERLCLEGASLLDAADTAVCPDTPRAARLAVGAAVEAVDRVVAGTWRNAFVACRPPGHHAERALAMGFCLYNNAAIAARHAQREHGLERVAIVDWDVHHGNGTQHLFEEDPTVYYASLHQFPHYPGTGAASERGRGAGEGATWNGPMPAGSGDAEWLAAFEDELLPAVAAFRPELVIVSAGFDAHRADPLSDTRLTEPGYRALTRGALQLAAEHASGRLVSLLEGGYDLEALASSVEAHLGELVEGSRAAP